MAKQLPTHRKQKKRRQLVIFIVGMLILFFVAAMVRIGVGEAEWAGMTVSNMTATLATEFNIPQGEQGVVVNVEAGVVPVQQSTCTGCDSRDCRVEDMGLREGKTVEVLSNGGRGPMLLKLEQTRLALGRGLAMKIFVRRS